MTRKRKIFLVYFIAVYVLFILFRESGLNFSSRFLISRPCILFIYSLRLWLKKWESCTQSADNSRAKVYLSLALCSVVESHRALYSTCTFYCYCVCANLVERSSIPEDICGGVTRRRQISLRASLFAFWNARRDRMTQSTDQNCRC